MLESMLYLLPVFIAAALGAITGHVVLGWHYKRRIRALQDKLDAVLIVISQNGKGAPGGSVRDARHRRQDP